MKSLRESQKLDEMSFFFGKNCSRCVGSWVRPAAWPPAVFRPTPNVSYRDEIRSPVWAAIEKEPHS